MLYQTPVCSCYCRVIATGFVHQNRKVYLKTDRKKLNRTILIPEIKYKFNQQNFFQATDVSLYLSFELEGDHLVLLKTC